MCSVVFMKIQRREKEWLIWPRTRTADAYWAFIIGWHYSKGFMDINFFEVLHPRSCWSLHFTNEDAETVHIRELGQGHRSRGQRSLIPTHGLAAWTEMALLKGRTWGRSWDFSYLFLFPWSSSISRDCPLSSDTHCWVTLGRVASQASVPTSVNAGPGSWRPPSVP